MTTPPPLAERVLRWSLAPGDREAVIGDFQEEFEAIRETRGAAAARQWYWTQTAASLPSNVLRRIRGERLRLRSAESADDRASRRNVRHAALVMVGVGLVIGGAGLVMDQATGGAFLAFALVPLAFVLLFFGLVLFFNSLSPWPERDPVTRAINQRRGQILWPLFLCWSFPDKIAPHAYQHVVARWELVPLLAGIALMLWPQKYWIFGGFVPAILAPQVWSPFFSTRREADQRIYLPVDAPSGPAQIGDVIVTRGGESRIGINRVFAAADTVRLFAPIGIGDAPVHVSVAVLTAHDTVAAEFQPVPTVSTPVEHPEWWRKPVPPTAQIDLAMPLHTFAPGNYRLAITATDGTAGCTKYADFRVAPDIE